MQLWNLSSREIDMNGFTYILALASNYKALECGVHSDTLVFVKVGRGIIGKIEVLLANSSQKLPVLLHSE